MSSWGNGPAEQRPAADVALTERGWLKDVNPSASAGRPGGLPLTQAQQAQKQGGGPGSSTPSRDGSNG